MCGIAGLYAFGTQKDSLINQVECMANALTHRGPDAQMTWSENELPLAFSHRRLSIQDLSPMGSQPMHSQSSRYTIVFNGEIYNFQAITKELQNHGTRFRGHSDTEVLLASIEQWGLIKTLNKCKGMFAFALWDDRERELTLVRDRMGEKPLYYGIVEGKLIFASELKAFYSIINQRQLKLDYDALGSYFRYGYISAPHSIFTNIKKLAPGALLRIPLSNKTTCSELEYMISNQEHHHVYWSLDKQVQNGSGNIITEESTAINSLDQLLNKIVNEQSISDVPIGSFLSGGIDSSLVSAISQANSATPINTFTIGFQDKSFDEAIYAKKVSEHLGTNHNELYVSSADILDVVPTIAKVYDEPFADSSQIPTILVCKQATKKVTVCLSGDGGDELFAGYNRYRVSQQSIEKMQQFPLFIRQAIKRLLKATPPKYWDNIYRWVHLLIRKKGASNIGLKIHKLAEMLEQKDLSSTYKYLCSYWQLPQQLFKRQISEPLLGENMAFDKNFLQSAMLWDQKFYLPGDNLVKSDRASMSASLEMRLPLLDNELLDFCWRIPNKMKLKGNQTKWLLRQVLYRYVPQELIERPKMGFSVPVASWIRDDLKEWCGDLLSVDRLNKQGIFDSNLITRLHKEHLMGRFDHSHKLWAMIAFQSWYGEYVGE